MKYNTLRQYFAYSRSSGLILDRRETKKRGYPMLLIQQIPLEWQKQTQFPHLGLRPLFIDLNRDLRRKRWKSRLWIFDLIHVLVYRTTPTGPLVYQSDKRYEYEERMRQAEQLLYKHTGKIQYTDLEELNVVAEIPRHLESDRPLSQDKEEHFRLRNLSWFKPVHPYIYWNWRAQSWTLTISHEGKKTSRSYPFNGYINAVNDLMAIGRRLNYDPDLIESWHRLVLPILPRSQSPRATAIGLRRPETPIEALWRYVDEERLRKNLGDTYKATLDHAVAARANQLADPEQKQDLGIDDFDLKDSDGVPLEDL